MIHEVAKPGHAPLPKPIDPLDALRMFISRTWKLVLAMVSTSGCWISLPSTWNAFFAAGIEIAIRDAAGKAGRRDVLSVSRIRSRARRQGRDGNAWLRNPAPGGVRLTPEGGRTGTRAACPAPGRTTEARRVNVRRLSAVIRN